VFNCLLICLEKNPTANRIITVPVEALQSAGLSISAGDEAVQAFIDEWWNDPIDGYIHQFYKDYQDNKLMGESVFPVGINPINGIIELGFIDPMNISSVLKVAGNARIDDRVILKPNLKGEQQSFDIIRKRQGVFTGDAFYFGFNKSTNGTRSRPELLKLLDWLDLFDSGMFNEAERWNLLSAFYFDIEMLNANSDQIKKYKNENFPTGKPPKSGTAFVHNEKIQQKIISPDLKAYQHTEAAKLQKQHIYGGAGYPDWFFGSGADTNQGVAREQMRPTIWLIEREQKRVSTMLYCILHFNLLQAQKHGYHTEAGLISESTDISFDINHNSVFPKDLVSNAVAYAQVTAAVNMQVDSGRMSEEVANEINASMVNELLDLDINPDDLVDELIAPVVDTRKAEELLRKDTINAIYEK